MGKLDFIGDVYQDTIVIPDTIVVHDTVKYKDMSYSEANVYVLNELKNNISNFSRYDNWNCQSLGHTFSEGAGDKWLDMIIVVYRRAAQNFGLNTGGIASLKLGRDFAFNGSDPVKIKSDPLTTPSYERSGITTAAGLSSKFGMITHLAHEFGHYIFGSGHTNIGGLMVGDPDSYYTSTYMMNGWERAWLGYINYKPVSSDGQIERLRDFVESGDCLKIPVPITNPNSPTFFIVEITNG